MFVGHAPELIIILAVALLIFGPKKLPEMGAAIGKGIKEFKKGMSELTAPKEEHGEDTPPTKMEAIGHKVASKIASVEATHDEAIHNEVSPIETEVHAE